MNTCGEFVSWWDGEYEGYCELPPEHDGPHDDGLSLYDDDGNQVDDPSDDDTTNPGKDTGASVSQVV